MNKACVFSVLVGSMLLMAGGCAREPAHVARSASTSATATDRCDQFGPHSKAYRIGVGDVLDIGVWNNKQLERTVTVRPDGMISFPLLAEISAAGKTPVQLSKTISGGLSAYMADPQVSVVVKSVHSLTVSVLGEVRSPGRYELNSGNTTVLDALAVAGGLTAYAEPGRIHVLHETSQGTHSIPFRYARAVSTRPGGSDFCVSPGDIVVVP